MGLAAFAAARAATVRAAADAVADGRALRDLAAALGEARAAEREDRAASRAALRRLDGALVSARAVQRKTPGLDAAVKRAAAVRDARADLLRRFSGPA